MSHLGKRVYYGPTTEQQRRHMIEVHEATSTAGVVTHCRRGHLDHLDRAGWQLFARYQVPVYCNYLDEAYLQRRSIVTTPLYANQRHEFLGGSIIAFETAHGYRAIGKLMGPGLGYHIELPGEPSIYISGDTVLTPIVRQVLTDLRPDIAVLNAGSASLDIGRPILMPRRIEMNQTQCSFYQSCQSFIRGR